MEKVERISGETPPALLSRPFPTRWDSGYWKAYQDLTGSRGWTFSGPAEISYINKIAWLDENQITDPDEREEYIEAIGKLDDHYLNYVYAKRDA